MFQMHRIFCATPWELEAERMAFTDLIGECNEKVAMPRNLLYVPVSLANMVDKRPYQYTVDENIRAARHYILVLAEGWGPDARNFRNDYRVALSAMQDSALPMRSVTVLLRTDPDGPSPFAAELERAGIVAQPYSGDAEFREKIRELFAGLIDGDVPAGFHAGCS